MWLCVCVCGCVPASQEVMRRLSVIEEEDRGGPDDGSSGIDSSEEDEPVGTVVRHDLVPVASPPLKLLSNDGVTEGSTATASTVDRSTGGSPTRRAHQRIVSLGYADDGAEGKSEADSPAGSPGIYTDDGEGDEDAWSYVL